MSKPRAVETAVIAAPVRFAAMRAAVEAALDRLGWAEAEPGGGEGAIFVQVLGDAGEAGAILEGEPALLTGSVVGLARDVAAALGAAVALHEVIGHDRWVKNPHDPGGEPGYDVRLASHEIRDGQVSPRVSAIDDPYETHGDLDETVGWYAWELAFPDRRGFADRWTTWRARVRPAGLSPRLADLARAIEQAGAWAIAREGARWRVTVASQATGKRMSFLDDAELAALRAAAAIPPRAE